MILRRFTLTKDMPDEARDRVLNEWSRDVEEALSSVPGEHGAAGAIYTTGGATAQTPGAAYVSMSVWQDGTGNPAGVLEEPSRGRIVVQSSGLWLAVLGLSFTGTASAIFNFAIALDNVRVPGGVIRQALDASGTVTRAAGSIPFRAHEGQSVSVHVKSDAAAKAYTLVEGSLSVARMR